VSDFSEINVSEALPDPRIQISFFLERFTAQ